MGGGRQRPATARAATARLKLHRRVLRLDGRTYTVVTPRPGTSARFSTNRFHGTWHVLSDRHGARFLARLLWGLAYQARPGTLLVIDRPFLVPTPFDADPADPIALVPSWHTPLTVRAARDLARRTRRPAPDGTVVWRTHGLDAAAADPRAWLSADDRPPYRDEGHFERRGGVVALLPRSAREARRWAVQASRLDPSGPYGTDAEFLGRTFGSCFYASGEIQVFRSFHRDVAVARRARADVLARPDAPTDPDDLGSEVWDRHGALDRGRARLIGNCGLPRRDAEALAAAGVRCLDDLVRVGAERAHALVRPASAPPDPVLLAALTGVIDRAAPA
ncbi:hypothetical protein BTM25_56790 [Actinomadura rubteroloni]|uniref:Uncharacterized protein n=1 Tax=Actinomadura rubteroloni TaxID=1926885 RepID=A0A2P4UB45_9ACTN|nr:hypothetical protein [Actinomadura rubteroloni]POM22267.1 hypothetical protein BTM25_56790 [Actinomadura rubteroloni]